jgi:hypothetical protein
VRTVCVLSCTPPETKHAFRAPCEPTHVKCREHRFAQAVHAASSTEEWQKTELLLVDSFSGHAWCACAAIYSAMPV